MLTIKKHALAANMEMHERNTVKNSKLMNHGVGMKHIPKQDKVT